MTTAEPNWATSGRRGLGYAAVTLAWSIVGLTVLITGVSVTAPLLVLVIGLPVWLGFAPLRAHRHALGLLTAVPAAPLPFRRDLIEQALRERARPRGRLRSSS
jgi:hypothetical protein